MFIDSSDKEIPLIDKTTLKEQLSSKFSLFISDCEAIHSSLNRSHFPSYDFENKQVELEAYFASLTVQLSTIEELVTCLISSNPSFNNYATSIVNSLSIKINELNENYKREYQLYSLMKRKESELNKKLYGEDMENYSCITDETNYRSDSRNENKTKEKEKDFGNARINDFIRQMIVIIDRITNKFSLVKSCDKYDSVFNIGIIHSEDNVDKISYSDNIPITTYERKKTLMIFVFSVLLVMFVVYSYIY